MEVNKVHGVFVGNIASCKPKVKPYTLVVAVEWDCSPKGWDFNPNLIKKTKTVESEGQHIPSKLFLVLETDTVISKELKYFLFINKEWKLLH
jgi:hypothetical protein